MYITGYTWFYPNCPPAGWSPQLGETTDPRCHISSPVSSQGDSPPPEREIDKRQSWQMSNIPSPYATGCVGVTLTVAGDVFWEMTLETNTTITADVKRICIYSGPKDRLIVNGAPGLFNASLLYTCCRQ